MEPVLATHQLQAQEQLPQQLTGFVFAHVMILDFHPLQVTLSSLFGVTQLSPVK